MEIVIIKLGAKGDVIRTTPLAEAIKNKHKDDRITWITKVNAIALLEGNPYIEEVCPIPYNGKMKFDILYNFDVEKDATSLAMDIEAKKKYGFYSEGGYPAAFNFGGEYYLSTIFDDEVKKNNKKTYQEMMFEVAEMKYGGEKCFLPLSDKDKLYAKNFAKKNKLTGKRVIGIHMGSSPRWPSKVWDEDRIIEFITQAKDKGYELILFAGPDESKRHEILNNKLKNKNIEVCSNNPGNSDGEFISLVNLCNVMICSDSFSLHVSLALEKKTIGLFFCTSPNEIEGYGILEKVVSPMLMEFFPERMDEYSPDLVRSISADEVIQKIK